MPSSPPTVPRLRPALASAPVPTRGATETAAWSGKALVGKRVRVWWEWDRKWYSGTIRAYTEISEQHMIVYDDGKLVSSTSTSR